MTTIHQ